MASHNRSFINLGGLDWFPILGHQYLHEGAWPLCNPGPWAHVLEHRFWSSLPKVFRRVGKYIKINHFIWNTVGYYLHLNRNTTSFLCCDKCPLLTEHTLTSLRRNCIYQSLWSPLASEHLRAYNGVGISVHSKLDYWMYSPHANSLFLIFLNIDKVKLVKSPNLSRRAVFFPGKESSSL